MDEHRQGIVADDPLHRIDTVGAGGLQLLVLHFAAGIGNIDSAVDHRRNAGARSAPGDGDDHVGIDFLVGLRPGLGDVDQRVGALVLNDRAGTAPTAAGNGQADQNDSKDEN